MPPYDTGKPPGYTSGAGYEGYEQEAEKSGYTAAGGESAGSTNPFADPAHQQGYAPPPGPPPPGLEQYVLNLSHDRANDEGFDPATLEAAIKRSEVETKGPGWNDDGAGPSSK